MVAACLGGARGWWREAVVVLSAAVAVAAAAAGACCIRVEGRPRRRKMRRMKSLAGSAWGGVCGDVWVGIEMWLAGKTMVERLGRC